ncbi:pyridoxamine 5'-phosphate oxidase family protein [Puia dinghuensis]|uniref:Pyridoxamine 5'-phosphate oxidase n=1 Tax=Puia dinghuensis TaxID=1792502 RepID=A0A8J2UH77_9BACT|nr:pyridoxamine 5'-phosphate oxidase family protein [Puia dinghuensis]GGB17404.1 pyridoxamine 5'-phosphate oxidase [Puia dinghuensis]
MTTEFLVQFIRRHSIAALATTSGNHQPEAAIVGIAVTDDLEIVFDTVRGSRKYPNLIECPRVALVIGWKHETTVQYEGVARELAGAEDDVYREVYYSVYPDGRQRAATWEGLVHFVVRPQWIRYSNFNEPVRIEEMRFS